MDLCTQELPHNRYSTMPPAAAANWEEPKVGEWHPYYLVLNFIVKFQPWENVVDWVQLLKNAMASIAVGVDPPPLLPQTSPDRLTCSLARMLDISEASSILVNVQLAALYLRHLVKVFFHIHSTSPSSFLYWNLPGES